MIQLSPLAFTSEEIQQAFTLLERDALGFMYRRHVTKHCTYQLHTGFTSRGSTSILESTAWSLGIQP